MSTTTRPGRAAALAALLRVVAAAACWALAGVLAKYAFQRGVPPLRLAEARVAVALAVLAPLLAWRRPGLLRPPPGLPLLAGFGACVAAVNASYYLAIDHLPVGVAVALQYTGPSLLLGPTALVRRGGPGWLRRGAWPRSTRWGCWPGWGRPSASPCTWSARRRPAAAASSRRRCCCGASWWRWRRGRWRPRGGRGRWRACATPRSPRRWRRSGCSAPWSRSSWRSARCGW